MHGAHVPVSRITADLEAGLSPDDRPGEPDAAGGGGYGDDRQARGDGAGGADFRQLAFLRAVRFRNRRAYVYFRFHGGSQGIK